MRRRAKAIARARGAEAVPARELGGLGSAGDDGDGDDGAGEGDGDGSDGAAPLDVDAARRLLVRALIEATSSESKLAMTATTVATAAGEQIARGRVLLAE